MIQLSKNPFDEFLPEDGMVNEIEAAHLFVKQSDWASVRRNMEEVAPKAMKGLFQPGNDEAYEVDWATLKNRIHDEPVDEKLRAHVQTHMQAFHELLHIWTNGDADQVNAEEPGGNMGAD